MIENYCLVTQALQALGPKTVKNITTLQAGYVLESTPCQEQVVWAVSNISGCVSYAGS